MGVVYRAKDTKLERDVALKLLPDAMAGDGERLERMKREARLVAGLNHPNIVTLHSVEEAEGKHFLTMELVHGKTLDQVVPRNGLDLKRLFDLAIPMADAVAAAHGAGITHRDLKPANVMVDPEGRVKILDFGLARFDPSMASERDETWAMEEAITGEGVVVGTVRYMSPEQARGEVVDARSDIFSLGALLYEMATGKQPFSGASSAELVSAILRDDPPPVYDVKKEMPHHLGRIIQLCLDKDPRKRFQSALDVRNELAALRREVESGASPIQRIDSTPTTLWRRAVPIGVLAIAAAAGFLIFDRATQERGVEESSRQTEARKTLVVLPFENLGQPEDAYFASGMTDELTSRLGRVSGLGVISRSSAARYAGTERSPQEVGRELGIDYVVEGTVRWARNVEGASRVRITPSLVHVVDGTQVWSASFDRELQDVFRIQAEIAEQVIAELGVTLLAPERAAVEDLPTDNQDAYQAYLKAQEHWQIAGYDPRRFRLAAELYERAAELDPDFMQPSATLVSVYGVLSYGSGDPSLLEKAERALARAEALAPEAPEVDIARGVWQYYGEQDFAAAYTLFESAARRLPNSIEPIQLMAFIRRRQGRLEEAIEHLEQVLELSPRDEHTHYELGRTHEAMRRFDEADRYISRARALAPDSLEMYRRHLWLTLRWTGDLEAAAAIADAAPNTDDRNREEMFGTLELMRRDWAALRERLEGRLAVTESDETLEAWDDMHLAQAYEGLGEDDLAETARLRAVVRARAYTEARPFDVWGLIALGLAEAQMGRRDAALSAVEGLPDLAGPDKFVAPLADEAKAWVLATLGDTDPAIDILEQLLVTHYDGPITKALLELDPFWDGLRGNPRYQQLIEESPQ